MFPNLVAEIAKSDLSKKYIAQQLCIAETSLFSKLRGKTQFTLKECKKIKSLLGLNVTLDYLFKEDRKEKC